MSFAATIVKHLVQLRQKSGIKHPRRRRLPKQIYPKFIERDFGAALAAMAVGPIQRAMRRVIAELPSLLQSARQSRGDGDEIRRFAGFKICVENPVGSIRSWVDHDGTTGETTMLHDYGYIDGAMGVDGEEVDVYLGNDPKAQWVYVIHQNKSPEFTEYDEDKVMLGFASTDAAEKAYLDQYDDPRFFGGMTVFPIEKFRELVGASSPMVFRADANEGKKARDLVGDAMRQVNDETSDKEVENLGRKYAGQVSGFQKAQLDRQVKAALGVEVPVKDQALKALVEHFASENASLVRSLHRGVHSELEKIITRAITGGTLVDVVAQQIQDRFNVAAAHSRLIARDQIGKLYGQINAKRQKELGIKRFIWRTVGDDRVRDEHEDLESKSEEEPFEYDNPPDDGLPGEPIQCRCYAEPVFEDVLDEIEDEEAADDEEDDDDEED